MANVNMQEYIEGGWGTANKILEDPTPEDKAAMNRSLEEQYNVDVSYLRCFSSPEGKVVLDHLTQDYIFKNSYNPGLVNPDQHGHFLEGHRNLVLLIIHRMNRAREGSPVQPVLDLGVG